MKTFDKLIFFGEISPNTIHGVSISNSINLNLLQTSYDIDIIEEKNDIKQHNIFTTQKINNFLRSYFIYLKKLFHTKYKYFYGVLYFSSFGIIKNILLIYALKLTRQNIKIILHIHRGDYKQFISKKINKYLFNLVDKYTYRYILLSSKQINEFAHLGNHRLFVLSNTIENELEVISYSSDKHMKLIYLGNYIREKGILELIESIKLYTDNNSNPIILNMYGKFTDSNLELEVINFINKNKLPIIINDILLGEEKLKTLMNSDLLILPSYNEGLPLVLLESLHVGTPVIISNVGFIEDVVGADYPFFCIPRDAKSISDAIFKYSLIEDKLEFRNNSANLYKRYSNHNHKSDLLKIFEIES